MEKAIKILRDILELKASHKQQIKEIKLRFIEDVISLKELVK